MQTAPKTVFGTHDLSLYDRTSGEFYGHIRVVGSLNLALEGDFVDLFGGCNKFAWDSEPGTIDGSLSGTVKELTNFSFEKFLGSEVTENTAEASGNVGTIANKKGTSAVNATTGIASVGALSGSETDLKDSYYLVKVVSATTVDVYAASSYDFVTGTKLTYQNDLLKITATPLTVPDTGGTVTIPNTGVEITGGSGSVAMTVDDTAVFTTRKINSGSDIIRVGANQTFPEFGAFITSCRKANGDTFRGQLFRCKGIGLPIGLTESAWLESDINIKVLYDSDEEAVAEIVRVFAA